MVVGLGFTDRVLTEDEVRATAEEGLTKLPLDGKKVLIITPDLTRTAPIPMMFRVLQDVLGDRVEALDFMIALGTHIPLDDERINKLYGLTPEERAGKYADTKFMNHEWDNDDALVQVGTLTEADSDRISSGMLIDEVPVYVNKTLFDYDRVIICGPTFPHEVVGFSGGNKYLLPGVAGKEIIDYFHWLGALITIMDIIGVKKTPVRDVIDHCAAMIDVPVSCMSLVVEHGDLAGLYIGSAKDAFSAAADLSAQLHVKWVDEPFDLALSVAPPMYDDLWTAAKAMYKLEPAIADGGEIIIYAPHLTEVSYVHGEDLDAIGYHVRDYFVKQWDTFKDVHGGVMAHSTHLKGAGKFEDGTETPRIKVTLATGIPEERCKMINLGYRDPATINVDDYVDREDECVLYVPKAGEMLYRLKSQRK